MHKQTFQLVSFLFLQIHHLACVPKALLLSSTFFWVFICWIYFVFSSKNELKRYLKESQWDVMRRWAAKTQTVFRHNEEHVFLLLYGCFVWDVCVDFENTARAFVKWCRSVKRQRIFDIKSFFGKYTTGCLCLNVNKWSDIQYFLYAMWPLSHYRFCDVKYILSFPWLLLGIVFQFIEVWNSCVYFIFFHSLWKHRLTKILKG